MKCSNCGQLVPDDSVFCPYCGTSIPDISASNSSSQPTEEIIEPQISDSSKTNPVSESDEDKQSINSHGIPSNQAEEANDIVDLSACDNSPKKIQRPSSRSRLLNIALTLFAIVLAGLSLYLIIHSKMLNSQIQDLQLEQASLMEEIASLESTHAEMEEKIGKLEEDKANLQETLSTLRDMNHSLVQRISSSTEIYDTLKKFNYGIRYSDYNSSTEVVVMKVGETKTFRITYTGSSRIRLSGGNSSSSANWGNDWINNTISVKIKGLSEGTTTYSFTNDGNSHSFKVLAIVLPK